MAYNKAKEEKKWRLWKEAEEKQLRSLGVNEDDIEKLRIHDWAIFNSDRRYYQRVQETGTYLDELVAPITSRIHTKAKLPTHTLINDFEGLDKNSIILLEQVRTIDKQRLKQYLGMIPDNIVARVDKALAISVALEKTKATDV